MWHNTPWWITDLSYWKWFDSEKNISTKLLTNVVKLVTLLLPNTDHHGWWFRFPHFVASSACLSLSLSLSRPFSSLAVKGLIVIPWDKGIHSSRIIKRSDHAKQTHPDSEASSLLAISLSCLLHTHKPVWRSLKCTADHSLWHTELGFLTTGGVFQKVY